MEGRLRVNVEGTERIETRVRIVGSGLRSRSVVAHFGARVLLRLGRRGLTANKKNMLEVKKTRDWCTKNLRNSICILSGATRDREVDLGQKKERTERAVTRNDPRAILVASIYRRPSSIASLGFDRASSARGTRASTEPASANGQSARHHLPKLSERRIH